MHDACNFERSRTTLLYIYTDITQNTVYNFFLLRVIFALLQYWKRFRHVLNSSRRSCVNLQRGNLSHWNSLKFAFRQGGRKGQKNPDANISLYTVAIYVWFVMQLCIIFLQFTWWKVWYEKRTHEHHFDKFPIILSTLVMNKYTGADSWKCPREGIRWKFLFPFEAEGGG